MIALTGLRGFAAMWVLACHAWTFLGQPQWELAGLDLAKLLAHGWAGVLIFFVLSGFLLGLPYVDQALRDRPAPATGPYLMRRVARVFPAYWAQLALLAAIAYLAGALPQLNGWSWLAHATMLFNLGPAPVAPLVGTWWSLPVEFGFYLCLPLMAPLLRLKRIWPLVVLALSISMLQHWLGRIWLADASVAELSMFVMQLPGYLILFVQGFAAAWWWRTRRRSASRWMLPSAWLLMVILVFAVNETFWQSDLTYFLWKPAFGCAVAMLVLGLLEQPRSWLQGRLAVWLGQISYSIYLWHLPIILLCASWMAPDGSWLLFLAGTTLTLALTIAISWFSYRYIEAPGIALGRRFSAKLG